MARWIVGITVERRYNVEVEAEGYGDARDTAAALPVDDSIEPSIGVDPLQRLGEPWAESHGWYDLHGPDDIVVVERSYGHRFDEQDIEILSERLTAIGLKVRDHWNGVGCSQVSFRCSSRRGTRRMSKKHLKVLLAPRPDAEGEEAT